MNDQQIEQEIRAKGLTAPRVTPADIEANIEIAYYFTGEEALQFAGQNGSPFTAHCSMKLLTFCVLVPRNGFPVTGEAYCADAERFDAETGRKIARKNAVQKLWPLMGYELKQRLFEQARGDVNQYEVEQNEARLTLVRAIADELDLPKSVTCDEMLKAVVDLKKGVL